MKLEKIFAHNLRVNIQSECAHSKCHFAQKHQTSYVRMAHGRGLFE